MSTNLRLVSVSTINKVKVKVREDWVDNKNKLDWVRLT
jgi:hypothetical protein